MDWQTASVFFGFAITIGMGFMAWGQLRERVNKHDVWLTELRELYATINQLYAFRDEAFRRLERIERKLDRANGN